MAAGMGSRFGGLKQIEPVGPNGEFILDYSIYDAIKAGYDKVVFIIKEENYDLFRKTIGKRIEKKIQVNYVFQKITDVPNGFKVPNDRVKPWGTSHAILTCKNVVNDKFVVINADDFYGLDPYVKLKKFLDNTSSENEYAMVGYNVKNTINQDKALKRGVCFKDENGYLTNILESSVLKTNDEYVATVLDNKKTFKIDANQLVSMNIWGFLPTVFDYLNEELNNAFYNNKDNLNSCEFLIPNSISNFINDKKIRVKVLDTNEKWYGMTYKEDKKYLVKEINKMIKKGKYPKKLWN